MELNSIDKKEIVIPSFLATSGKLSDDSLNQKDWMSSFNGLGQDLSSPEVIDEGS